MLAVLRGTTFFSSRVWLDTWSPIHDHVVASFRALQAGLFPQTDPFGNLFPDESFQHALAHGVFGDLCGGQWLGFLFVVAADLDFAANALGTKRYNSVECCWLCDGRQDNGPLNCRVCVSRNLHLGKQQHRLNKRKGRVAQTRFV